MPTPKKFAFTYKATTSKVNGEEYEFYELSYRALEEARALAVPLAKAVTALFSEPERQSGSTNEKLSNRAGESIERFIANPTSPELAETVANQKSAAVGTIVETLLNGQHKAALATILLDSLTKPSARPKDGFDSEQLEEFMSGVTVPVLIQLVIGAVKANMEVFGPVGKQIAAGVGKALASMTAPESSETPTAPGSESKTPSSSQLVEASSSTGS